MWQRLKPADALFAAAFTACLALVIAPLWIGPAPPLTDFGAQAAMADVYARLDDVELYSARFERSPDVLAPGLLMTRLVAWVSPAVDIVTGLRLFATLALIGQVAGLLALLHAFGRSRWLLFAMLPGLWNGMFALALLSYCASLGTILGSVAAARYASRGSLRACGALLALSLGTYFLHPIGCAFLGLLAGATLVLSTRRAKHLLGLAALVPAGGLLGRWLFARGGGESATGSMEWRDALSAVKWAIEQSHDLVTFDVDTYVFLALFGVWIVLMTTRSSSSDGSGGVLDPLVLPILALVVGVGLLALPAYVDRTGVSSRLAPLFVWLLLALPMARPDTTVVRASMGAFIVVALVYGVCLVRWTSEFEEEHVEPLTEIVDRLPWGKRVEVVGVCGGQRSAIFTRWPLCHLAKGLVHVRRTGFSGGGFARNPGNAIRFRPGARYSTLEGVHTWSASTWLREWDYVIVLGTAPDPSPTVRLVTEVPETDGRRWRLYEVVR